MRFKEEFNDKIWKLSRAILRIGISLVFIWFGFKQLIDPSYLVSYLPEFFQNLSVSATSIMLVVGLFEAIFGILLLLGYYVRFVSFILGLHMLFIIFSVGYNDIGVRDFGLFVSCVAIFLNGRDGFCLGRKKGKR